MNICMTIFHFRLLDSEYFQGIPHLDQVKSNLVRATEEYLARYDKVRCSQCDKEPLAVHDLVTKQDGCLCLDLSTTYDTALCPPISEFILV